MNKKIGLILIAIIILVSVPTQALENNLYEISSVINNIKYLSYINLDCFNPNILNIFELDDILNDNELIDKKVRIVSVERGAKIKTIEDDVFIAADILNINKGKIGHEGKAIYMDGEVEIAKIRDNKIIERKLITTKEERSLIDSNQLDYEYWNFFEYKKGGYIKFDEPGYYNVVVKNSSYDNTLDNFILKVGVNEELEVHNFEDITKDKWFYDDVYRAAKLGFLKGKDDNLFDPYGKLTIAEALSLASVILADYEGLYFIPGGNQWYENAYRFAEAKGIVDKNEFLDLERNATREEIAYIFARTLPRTEYQVINDIDEPFSDLSVNKYYDYVINMYQAGIIAGKENNVFDPKSFTDRGEVAAIINRLVIKDLRADFNQ